MILHIFVHRDSWVDMLLRVQVLSTRKESSVSSLRTAGSGSLSQFGTEAFKAGDFSFNLVETPRPSTGENDNTLNGNLRVSLK